MFHYHYNESQSTVIISLPENVLGGDEVMLFNSLIADLSNTKKPKLFLLDLSDVKVMNSSGIGMLASALTTAKRFNIELALASIDPKIEKLLVITGLSKIFKVFDSVEQALSSI